MSRCLVPVASIALAVMACELPTQPASSTHQGHTPANERGDHDPDLSGHQEQDPNNEKTAAQSMSRVQHNGEPMFVSGANVAWFDYAADVGNFDIDIDAVDLALKDVERAGGNAMRWWIHVNGSFSPEFDDSGRVSGIHPKTIEGIIRALDRAQTRGIVLKLCLWSFDMLRPQYRADMDRNYQLLTDEASLQAYINNALIPMVSEIGQHPALLAWEIFNEPEGMTPDFGWTERRVEMWHIQRFVNQTAGAIHRASPGAKVTVGSWSFIASSDVDDNHNYYRDDRLLSAGGDPDGHLDFLSVHYYSWGRTELSPFHHPAVHWGIDKPIVVAEFYAEDTYGVDRRALFAQLYDNGYAGALGWQWNEHWDNIEPAIKAVRDRHAVALEPSAPDDRRAHAPIEPIVLEAEHSDTSLERFDEPQASGGAYVTMNEQGHLGFLVEVPSSGRYQVEIGYRSVYEDKTQELVITGGDSQSVTFPQSDSWRAVEVNVYLPSQSNVLEIRKHWGYMDFDYIRVR